MNTVSDIFEAINAGEPAMVKSLVLALLATELTDDAQLSRDDVMDIAFDVGDWLFMQGEAQAGADVYAATFKKIEETGPAPRFELARRLDQMAKHLASAGMPEAAASALKGAIELSRDDNDLDGPAQLWRLQRSQDIKNAIPAEYGSYADPSADKAEAEILSRRLGVNELRYDRHSRTATGGAPGLPPSAEIARGPQHKKLDDTLSSVPDSKDYLKVLIHYATHRKPQSGADQTAYDPYDRYGFEPADHLQFGRALVTVPADRIVGHYEEPSSAWLGNGGALEKSFTVQAVDILDETIVLAEVGDIVTHSNRKELLVFAHGFWTNFTSGLMRCAQLKVDMKIEGAAVLYSLPSKGKWWGYGHDRVNAQNTVTQEQLRDFLLKLSEESGATRIYLVAHSLACEMLIHTLNKIWDRDQPEPKQRFSEVIFAAPDVDHVQFQQLVPRASTMARRVTVYASKWDLPLWLLGSVIDRGRAGFDASKLAGLANVDSIDTSAGAGWFTSLRSRWGHWDFADGSIDDVRAVVWHSLTPAGRRSLLIRQQRPDGAAYWTVQPDVVIGIFRKALEWVRELGLIKALETAQNGVTAERAMQPPGAQLAEFENLHDELTVFQGSQSPES